MGINSTNILLLLYSVYYNKLFKGQFFWVRPSSTRSPDIIRSTVQSPVTYELNRKPGDALLFSVYCIFCAEFMSPELEKCIKKWWPSLTGYNVACAGRKTNNSVSITSSVLSQVLSSSEILPFLHFPITTFIEHASIAKNCTKYTNRTSTRRDLYAYESIAIIQVNKRRDT